MADGWFSDEKLARPTKDRAIEAIDAGDLERARTLCEGMKHDPAAIPARYWKRYGETKP